MQRCLFKFPTALRNLHTSTTAKVTLIFLLVYLFAIQACRVHLNRDPTSLFFNQLSKFPKYSVHREYEATKFIVNASFEVQPKVSHSKAPKLCVGITSKLRLSGEHYLYKAVGSLLHGLHEHERGQIHLMIFLAQTHPLYIHPAASESWLGNVADTIHAGYANFGLSPSEGDFMKDVEFVHERVTEKAPLDYMFLLKACHDTDAQYVAMLSDDILALDGWFHRTVAALDEIDVERQTTNAPDFLYLRLFYVEQDLGWRAYYWPTYLFWCSTIIVLELVVLLLIRTSFLPALKSTYLSNRQLLVCSLVFTPLCIILFFAVGRSSVFRFTAGVHQLGSGYGCCAQGLVYPNSRVPSLVEWLDMHRIGFVDELIEQYADQTNRVRWVLSPSVLQHAGARSAEWDDGGLRQAAGRSSSGEVWSYGFEVNDPEKLRLEHLAVSQRY